MHPYAELYNDLLDDLQIHEGILVSDLSVVDARKLWLKNSFFKKLAEGKSSDADRVCLDKFLAFNGACHGFKLRPFHIFHDHVIGEVKQFFDNMFNAGPDPYLHISRFFEYAGVGPGANIGAKSHNFYTKVFNSDLSRTSDRLYREYRYAIARNPTWTEAEIRRQEMYGDSIVAGNRLSFVPKTFEVSRSICTEPTLNMLFQKWIGGTIRSRLRTMTGIDLSKQPERNRALARLGSIDGSFGTIDLSNASDSISIGLCEAILPPYVFRWLMLTRAANCTLPSGQVVKLEMIASMGNDFTFPLQTAIFAALVTASYRIMGIKPHRCSDGLSNYAVFGDDIIVRRDAYDFVVQNLALFGFTVNDGKSFNTGSFRESCGNDFYKGHEIRGVYIRSLQHDTNVYSAFNRLVRWQAAAGVSLPRVNARLLEKLRFNLCVPFTRADTEGIKAPSELARRINQQNYPRLLEAIDQVKERPRRSNAQRRGPLKLDSITSISRRQVARLRSWQHSVFANGTISYDYLCVLGPKQDYSVPTTEVEPTKIPDFRYNGAGIMVALLGGFIRNGRISVRPNRKTAQVRMVTSHSWLDRPVASRWKDDPYYENSLRSFDPHSLYQNFELGSNIGPDDFWEEVAALCLTTVDRIA